MRVNLAKVVPWLGILLVAIIWIAAQNTDTSTDPSTSTALADSSPSQPTSDTSRADAYFDSVATELAQPGVYVDPAVTEISAADAARLDALAKDTAGPVRVLVAPADALRALDPTDPEADPYSNVIVYPDDDLPGQLYDRVGGDGTYAVLVDADSSYDGRSFNANQFAEERPYYQVEDALNHAVDCCAPDYTRMLDAFLAEAGTEQTNPWPVVGWVVAALAALIGLVWGGSRWSRWRRQRTEDEQVADGLRPSLQDEVVELEGTVAALPPAPPAPVPIAEPAVGRPGGDDIATRTRRVLDLVEDARHRLDAEGHDRMDTPAEAEEVVQRLADARYELVAIDELRNGRPVPEQTAPCFFDPRHGPSVAEVAFTPEGGAERSVPVCAACRDELAAGKVPETRQLQIGGLLRPYWQWDRYTRPLRQRLLAAVRLRRPVGAAEPVRAVARGRPPRLEAGRPVRVGERLGRHQRQQHGQLVVVRRWGRRQQPPLRGQLGPRSSFGGGSSHRSSSRSGGSRRF